jgi:hypothetical protein
MVPRADLQGGEHATPEQNKRVRQHQHYLELHPDVPALFTLWTEETEAGAMQGRDQ